MSLGFLWAGHDYSRAGEWFRQTGVLAEALADPLLQAHSLNRLANWFVNTGRTAEGIQTHQEALTIFEARQNSAGDGRDAGFAGHDTRTSWRLSQRSELLRASFSPRKPSNRCPVAHPGTLGKHHQVGEDQPPHLPIIAPRGGVNNRCLWLKDLPKEGGHVLKYRVVGMHVWLMGDEPGCCPTL